ncbi:MAG TPA: glycosyltransferase family 39 protein [Candidatus Latescibacteria bacterium]|nr:glycosyltransferase family 39 protein [Candidatus Latescibacterota bacterium]
MWAIDRRTGWFVVFSACIGACAFFAILWITAGGIGVSDDPIVYLETAKNLLAGNGFVVHGTPMTHYPPLFPLMLAGSGLGGADLLQSARFLNALLFSANVVLCSLAVWIATKRSLLAAAITGCLVMVLLPIVKWHAQVYSEPPFLMFALIAIILLAEYVRSGGGRWLYLASSAIGLTMLTRYVGAAFVPVLIAIPFFSSSRPFRVRARIAGIAALVACSPLALWLAYNLSRAQTATNRMLAFRPPQVNEVTDFIWQAEAKLLPGAPLPLKVALFFVFLSGVVWCGVLLHREGFFSRRLTRSEVALPLVSASFSAAYFAFLVVSISFFDHSSIRQGTRLFVPILFFLLLAGIAMGWITCARLERGPVCWVLVSLASGLFLIQARDSWVFAAETHANGLYYNSVTWRNSETIAAAKSLPPDVRIFANNVGGVSFQIGRRVSSLPSKFDYGTMQKRHQFAEQLGAVCKAVLDSGAVIVYFSPGWAPHLPTHVDLETACPLPVLGRFRDGIIYGNPPKRR